jgi:cytochrome c-type biogenesis protein CcmH
VRERLTKGDSDEQVIGFLVSRYGEFVLLKPPFEWHTAILWLTPLFAVLVGAIAMFAAIRRRRISTSPPLPLDADEERRLREVLDKSG